MRKIEQPIVTTDPHDDRGTITTHPSFAMIGAYRTEGRTALHGSEVVHNSYITIKITRSEMRRTHSRWWFFGRKRVIEVSLSGAQWAEFLSNMNVGDGVPCTLEYADGVNVPRLPDPVMPTQKFEEEARGKLDAALQELAELNSFVASDQVKIPAKTKEHIHSRLNMATMQIRSNLPFVMESVVEHMEEFVTKAKIEVSAWATHQLVKLGLARINGQDGPIEIEDKSGEKTG